MYSQVITELGKYGKVLTEHIGGKSLSSLGEMMTSKEIFDRDMAWVREADVIVAEVSTPSLGVGYELGQAEAMGKKIVCLFRPQEGKRLSAMVSGNSYNKIFEYQTLEDVARILAENLAGK